MQKQKNNCWRSQDHRISMVAFISTNHKGQNLDKKF